MRPEDSFWNKHNLLLCLCVLLLTGAFINNGFLEISMMFVRIGVSVITILLLMREKAIWKYLFVNRLLLALIALAVLSSLWSPYPSFSLRRAFALVSVSLLGVYIAAHYSLGEQLRLYLSVMSFILLASLCFVVFLPDYAVMTGRHLGSWNGILAHKNLLARLTTMLFIFLLFIPQSSLSYPRWQKYGLLLLCLLTLFFSDSATSWVVLLGFCLLRIFHGIVLSKSPLLFWGICLCLGTVMFWLLLIALWNYETLFAVLGRDPSLTGRSDLWAGALQVIRENWFLGQGYSVAFLANAPIFDHIGWVTAPNAHNAWLDIALELGLVGVLIYTLGLLQNLFRALQYLRNPENPLRLIPFIFFLAFLALSITETNSFILRDMFWTMYVSFSVFLCQKTD